MPDLALLAFPSMTGDIPADGKGSEKDITAGNLGRNMPPLQHHAAHKSSLNGIFVSWPFDRQNGRRDGPVKAAVE
jgi:hypothetical protein